MNQHSTPKTLTHDVVVAHAAHAMQGGSSSFAAAARLFDDTTRESTLMLYAWCRHCDDVVDGQSLGHDAHALSREEGEARLAGLEDATRRACAGEPSDDPVFAGLTEVVQRHGVDVSLLLDHLAGFRMDVEDRHYATLSDTLLYCYRVAGVVGLMMARVMGSPLISIGRGRSKNLSRPRNRPSNAVASRTRTVEPSSSFARWSRSSTAAWRTSSKRRDLERTL